jgi:hypothetical protein
METSKRSGMIHNTGRESYKYGRWSGKYFLVRRPISRYHLLHTVFRLLFAKGAIMNEYGRRIFFFFGKNTPLIRRPTCEISCYRKVFSLQFAKRKPI